MNEHKPQASRWTSAFWVISTAALAGMVVTAWLGVWQLDRAHQKISLSAEMLARGKQPVLAQAELQNALATSAAAEETSRLLYRKTYLSGQWAVNQTVYVDNRQMDGRQGFYVFTPLVLEGARQAIVVQRGWIPRNFENRTALAKIETTSAEVNVAGHLAPAPSRTFSLGSIRSGAGFERIRQNLNLKDFRQETGLPLASITLVQEGLASEGLLRQWPFVAAGVERHYGYAFQWFALCVLIAGLYVWFQIVQPRRRHV